MDCPYCGGAMQHGELHGDGREKVSWYPEKHYPQSPLDKIFSGDKRRLKNVAYKVGFWIQADWCPTCRKMIFETDLT